jgi:hypothetical protein
MHRQAYFFAPGRRAACECCQRARLLCPEALGSRKSGAECLPMMIQVIKAAFCQYCPPAMAMKHHRRLCLRCLHALS